MQAKDSPDVHEDDLPGLTYSTLVDSVANPEIFVTPKDHFAYPAYIIQISTAVPASVG